MFQNYFPSIPSLEQVEVYVEGIIWVIKEVMFNQVKLPFSL